MTLERKFEAESLQKFLDYANGWWTDYKQVRPSHKSRLVKIFAETDDREASVYKPVCTLIQPMNADRLLETPLHAARFVSLIPFQRLEAIGKERVEVWHSVQSFLSRGCGDSEDHAVLLCNLLLGFGLEAYVCIGTNSEGSHAWVMTKSPDPSKKKVHFWESLTGTKLEQEDPRVHRFYRTVDCVFNHRAFYGNLQADNRVINTDWNFQDEFSWKAMLQTMLNLLTPAQGIGYL
jgi:centrosomal protein CEP76